MTTPIDYHSLAKTMASRYKVSYDQKQDLVQEAYLAYLECLEKGCDHPDIIQTSMRQAMYDYTNFRQRPIEVPKDNNNRGLRRRWENLESLDGLSPTEKALYFALTGEYVGVDALEKELMEDSHEDLVNLGMAITQALTEQEASVFRKIALHGYELQEVGKAMGMSKQAVHQIYQAAVDKLKDKIM